MEPLARIFRTLHTANQNNSQGYRRETIAQMLLAEANRGRRIRGLFGDGDECHMAFHFPPMPRMYMALRARIAFRHHIMAADARDIPANCQWAIFLRNHDELTLEMVTPSLSGIFSGKPMPPTAVRGINLGIRRRLAPLLERDRRRIELLNYLLFVGCRERR